MAATSANGQGVAPDAVEAVRWFRRAAESGHSGAQHDLALAHLHGWGAVQDDAEARRWFLPAAEQGHPRAQFWIGLMYAGSWGGSPRPAEAVAWLGRAAEQGHAAAARALPVLCEKRPVAERRPEACGEAGTNRGAGYPAPGESGDPGGDGEALEWSRFAAERGFGKAQRWLGRVYFGGLGVPRDPARGFAWLALANDGGGGSPELGYLRILMTDAETERAHALMDRLYDTMGSRRATPSMP